MNLQSTSLKERIVKCPSCGARQWQNTLHKNYDPMWPLGISFSLMGNVLYSDGNIVNEDPLLENPRYVKCPECGSFFKTDGLVSRLQQCVEINLSNEAAAQNLASDSVTIQGEKYSKDWSAIILVTNTNSRKWEY
jgi:DNA-directed RNA polymerase subunit RPC12/RpoP